MGPIPRITVEVALLSQLRRGGVNELPLPVLIVLVIAAIALGLFLGAKAGKPLGKHKDGSDRDSTLAARARAMATRGVVRLWVWNRDRKKRRDDDRD